MDNSEENIIKLLTQGSEEAFTAIYDKYAYSMITFASQLVNNSQEAQDICADVFMKLWEMRANFSTTKNIKAFLYIAVRNACFNFLKHLQIRTRKQEELIYHLHQISRPDELPMDIRSKYLERVLLEIESLPDKCKQVFKLSYFESMTNKEISNLLRISDKTVRNQKALALRSLRINSLARKLLINIATFYISYALMHKLFSLSIYYHFMK